MKHLILLMLFVIVFSLLVYFLSNFIQNRHNQFEEDNKEPKLIYVVDNCSIYKFYDFEETYEPKYLYKCGTESKISF